MNVGELRELLADLPDEALVLSSGVQGSGEAYLVRGGMSPARALAGDIGYDYWNDNELDAVEYADSHPTPEFGELAPCMVLFWD